MPAAFRLYSKMDTFWGLTGQLLPGGYLKFYDAGTTTPKDVFGEKALATNNGSTIALDASSRPSLDVWGSGAYFVEIYDADDNKQGEADNVEIPGGEATALPALVDGEFLTNDGSVMSWAEVREVPDPTGHADEVLSSDGTALTWIQKPSNGADANDPITDGRIQSGTDSASASGAKIATKSVTFGTAYSAAPIVVATVKGTAPTSSGAYPKVSITAVSTTGFTVTFSTTTGGTSADSFSGSDLSGTTNFNWIAVGVVP